MLLPVSGHLNWLFLKLIESPPKNSSEREVLCKKMNETTFQTKHQYCSLSHWEKLEKRQEQKVCEFLDSIEVSDGHFSKVAAFSIIFKCGAQNCLEYCFLKNQLASWSVFSIKNWSNEGFFGCFCRIINLNSNLDLYFTFFPILL